MPLLRRAQLVDHGWHSRRVRRELETGHLRAIRPGVYVRAADFDGLGPEQKVIVAARALAQASISPPVFCGVTAAAVLGLPCLRGDGRLHVLAAESRSSGATGVVRHRSLTEGTELVDVAGLRCTPVARTIADVARGETRETALSIADAALRARAFRSPRRYDRDEAEHLREEALEWARNSTRGRRMAEWILRFADGRAQRPGESVSRLRLHDLGFAPPSLQAAVPGPHGATYWVDFGLDDVDAWGEFDGRVKYRGIAAAAGRTPQSVIEEEKRREDWIRGTTQRRFARWSWEDLADAATLGHRLAAFGIVPRGNGARSVRRGAQ
ncbi:hypothetical protein CH252_26865 [Rhodococcus sp. 06-1477-1B]|nr:hypothetical protein CH252_26865 [Rhodococcus sp. 06-1477-1B]